MSAAHTWELLDRVDQARGRLASRRSARDAEELARRVGERTRRLESLTTDMNQCADAVAELREAGVECALPSPPRPPEGLVDLTEWWDTGSAELFVSSARDLIVELEAQVTERWLELLERLRPALPPASVIERLGRQRPELEPACDALADAASDWLDVAGRPRPGPGDAARAEQTSRAVAAAWAELEAAGATSEQIELLELLLKGRVTLAALSAEHADWLRAMELADQVFLKLGES